MIEEKIIEESKNGSLTAFRKLVGQASPFAFSVAFRILGDEEPAMDVVQETMISIWKNLKKIKTPGTFKTWLYRIVVNKCYDQLRRKKRIPEINADERTWALISNNLSEEPSKEMENRETAQFIKLLTDKLSPKQKAVFVLCDLEEMSNEEVSLITGLSRTNVKANLHYARKKISEMIEKHI